MQNANIISPAPPPKGLEKLSCPLSFPIAWQSFLAYPVFRHLIHTMMPVSYIQSTLPRVSDGMPARLSHQLDAVKRLEAPGKSSMVSCMELPDMSCSVPGLPSSMLNLPCTTSRHECLLALPVGRQLSDLELCALWKHTIKCLLWVPMAKGQDEAGWFCQQFLRQSMV